MTPSPHIAWIAKIAAALPMAAIALGVALAPPAGADNTGTSSSFQGFGSNKDPISIDADNLNVAGPDQIVTITGNVVVKQKDTTLNTQTLKVFYENKPGTTPASDPATSGTQVRRFEAYNGLKITQPDQTVTGDTGWFDMPSQKAEVNGSVVLTQGKNVARGKRLLVNLKTGEYRLEGRVQILLEQTGPAASPAPAPKSK
ncbi:MAG: LptA/OstA family protein [Ancalomicrobiaceae bacterium]|nr:LptA/OstA family protein [Ancalomicrobiaceae bacterium]